MHVPDRFPRRIDAGDEAIGGCWTLPLSPILSQTAPCLPKAWKPVQAVASIEREPWWAPPERRRALDDVTGGR
jgi:hypothetical protein